MHLIINTLSITPDAGGIKTYLINVISNLVTLSELEEEGSITLICSKSSYPVFEPWKDHNNVHFKIIPVSSKKNFFRIFLDQIIVPLLLLYWYNHKNTTLITPSSIATILSPIKQITIIQTSVVLKNVRSTLPKEYVSDFSFLQKAYYDIFLGITLRRSDSIIAVSEFLKTKMLELNPSFEKKITVVYEGVELKNFNSRPKKNALDGNKFEVLYVSTLYGYKNADKLINALKHLKFEKSLNKEVHLTIVGDDPSGGKRLNDLKSLTVKLGVEEEVEYAGYVAHNEVQKYYKKASVFVFPSSVESFGLPPLEAMASGVPVIGSNRMSVPEIIGDAGLIVDPDDIDSIVEAIFKIIQDDTLRKKLISRGYDRVENFKWIDAAKKITRIVNELNKDESF